MRHSMTREAQWTRWSRKGGEIATRRPLPADVPVEPLVSRQETSRARSEVYALVKAQAISAPVGATLGKLLADADAARSRDEALALERRRQVTTPRVVVRIAGFATMRPALSDPAPSTKEASHAPDGALVPPTFSWKRDLP